MGPAWSPKRCTATNPIRRHREPHRHLACPCASIIAGILATAISRLRAKLKYRPVIFELMPVEFTLTDLQRTVEAISGRHLHKQNFRRLVERSALLEPTGKLAQQNAAGQRNFSDSAARSSRNARHRD